MQKSIGGIKDQIMNLFTKTKAYSKTKLVKTVYRSGKKISKSKIQKQNEDNIIKNIRNLFKIKKENEVIEERIIRDIKIIFQQE